MTKLCIGIDIGGTNLKSGLMTGKGTMLEEYMIQLEEENKSEAGIIDVASKAIDKLLNVSGFSRDSIIGVGIGAAGVIDHKKSIITKSPHFPLWKDFAFGTRLSNRTDMMVAMENDVNAVARGEQWCGAVKGEKNFLTMAIGTGLGGAICLDGKIWRGVDGMAGEVGHINIDPNGLPCNCGSRGCLETVASSTALIARVKKDDYRPVLDKVENDAGIAHQLALLADEGDTTARAYWEDLGRAIGLALADLLNILNLKLVLLGGGLSKAFTHFYPALEAELQKRAYPSIWHGVEFRNSQLWEKAGVYGAAANLLIELKELEKKI